MPRSPMQMSLAHLRSQGYLCAIVEHWNPHAKVRQDLFGFADILAVMSDARGWKKVGAATAYDKPFLFIQTTSYANVPARVKKIQASPEAKCVFAAGGRIFVQGWDRNRFREVEVTL